MNSSVLHAFSDELEKIAAAPVGLGSVGANLMGTVKALRRPGHAIREGWKETVKGLRGPGIAPKVNAGLLAVGTVAGVPELVRKEDPHGNRSRLARAAAFTGSQIGGLIGAPFGLTGGIVGGVGGEVAGRVVGRGIDALRGRPRVAPTPVAPVTPAPVPGAVA